MEAAVGGAGVVQVLEHVDAAVRRVVAEVEPALGRGAMAELADVADDGSILGR